MRGRGSAPDGQGLAHVNGGAPSAEGSIRCRVSLTHATSLLYGERVIHGCIYQARPDVHAVCHHHSRAVMPFCISGVPLQPVDHLGATMGATIPFWDQRDEFGDTNLSVRW